MVQLLVIYLSFSLAIRGKRCVHMGFCVYGCELVLKDDFYELFVFVALSLDLILVIWYGP